VVSMVMTTIFGREGAVAANAMGTRKIQSKHCCKTRMR